MRFVHSAHGVYYAQYHVCWCVKYRRRILNPGVGIYLRKILTKIVKSMAEVKLIEMGIDDKMRDHVHLVIQIPPKYSASKVVAQLKSQSASLLRRKYQWLEKVFWEENIVWSPGFFLSTIGVNEKIIKKYVQWQGKKDSGQIQLSLLK